MKAEKEILRAAFGEGFQLAGIAPRAVPEYVPILRDWVERGVPPHLDYMKKAVEERCDARNLLPEARAVIVLGMSYFARPFSEPSREAPPGRGVIARYAMGRDYHGVLKTKLRKVADLIRRLGGKALIAVDSSPLLEKGFAMKAGLGWVGRNTLLINPDYGSWLVLGEIVTDLDLEPSCSLEDQCGSCMKCVEACPSGALNGEYGLDAAKCFSFQTIENRGEIPVDMRSKLGSRLFGCDSCQEVCPLNDKARATREEGFLPRDALLFPDPTRFIATILEDRVPEDSPLLRAGKKGLLRNLAVVMGNLGEERLLPLLERLSSSEWETVRSHSRWAISKIKRGKGADL